MFEIRPSDSPYAERITWSRADEDGYSVLPADGNCYLFIQRYQGKAQIAIGGALTQVLALPIRGDTEWFGIRFEVGTFLPLLPPTSLMNTAQFLPQAGDNSFWLHGSVWEFPTYENVDTFLERLVRDEVLVRDPVIEAALAGQPTDYSPRSLQRRFLRATGLSQSYLRRIERARRAAELLQQGRSIIDTTYEAGYFDQPHLTRALKFFMGQTPAQIAEMRQYG